jgi:hypothetical protein
MKKKKKLNDAEVSNIYGGGGRRIAPGSTLRAQVIKTTSKGQVTLNTLQNGVFTVELTPDQAKKYRLGDMVFLNDKIQTSYDFKNFIGENGEWVRRAW